MSLLAAATDPAWAEHVLARSDELLLDHAHCERKAAATALSLVRRHPEHAFLARPLAALAREEGAHFARVVRRLEARGLGFRPLRPGPYAARLRAAVRGAQPARLVDTLLCCALIEARSCERFGLLAARAPAPLAALYRSLLAAEARHQNLFVRLAARLAPRAAVDARLRVLSRHEADVIAAAPPLIRVHGGAPAGRRAGSRARSAAPGVGPSAAPAR